MAFKMNRPVIKGAASHKVSIAKAKEKSIVSQARTQADPSLSFAAEQLGRSRIGKSVDYTIDPGKVEIQSTYEKELKDPKERRRRRKKTEDELAIEQSHLENKYQTEGVYDPTRDAEGKKLKKEKGDSKISKAIQAIKDKIEAKRAKNKAKYDAEQAEKQRIKEENARLNAEKQAAKDKVKADKLAEQARIKAEKAQAKADAKYIGEGEIEDPNVQYKDSKDYKTREEERINQERLDAKYIGEGDIEDPNVQYKDTEAYKADERARIEEERRLSSADDQATFNRELNLSQEQDLQSDLMQSIEGKDTEDVKVRKEGDVISLEDIQEMNRKAKMSGEIESRSYTAEEAKRLVFDPNTNEMRLPEEITADKTVYSTDEGAPNDVALAPRTGRQRRLDKKYENSGPSVRANMIKDGYTPPPNSPAQKRDDRIFANALPNGVLRKNMMKSGYIPRDQR